MKAEEFFSRLWDQYVQIAPTAQRVRHLVEERFGPVVNDHVAFRTFDCAPIALDDLERAFLEWGYRRDRLYEFADKHLRAYGYIPPHEGLPLVFLSELQTEHLSQMGREFAQGAAAQIDPDSSPSELLLSGRVWDMPSSETYAALEVESAYAAWLSVWGLCANHFTIAVHRLGGTVALSQVVEMLREEGFSMNEVGGLYKGTPGDLLQQASTVAESRPVTFSDGVTRPVLSCYYEFAQRHRGADGDYYLGFVPKSANDIFESTTEQKGTPSHDGEAPLRKD